jgi:hypothetical protein
MLSSGMISADPLSKKLVYRFYREEGLGLRARRKSRSGKIATLPVDGFVVANPLYLPGENVLGKGVHNVVYVVTLHDSVYAFDADSANTTPLWTTSILNYSPAGATPVPGSVKRVTTTTGWSEVGIVSTPVIDQATGTLYLVAETYENNNVVHRLHALDVTSGMEIAGAPVTVAARYTLNGATTTFRDLYELNRPGLLLGGLEVNTSIQSEESLESPVAVC